MSDIQKNVILCGDNIKILETFPNECIDLTVTSPPYDDMTEDFVPIQKGGLRSYNGYTWDFKGLANQLYRVTKTGGVVVWVISDPTIDGSESLASSLQKIYFRRIGFNIHDTMIWNKDQYSSPGDLSVRYGQVFEYMLVLSKGIPRTFNPIMDRKTIHGGVPQHGRVRNPKGDGLRKVSGAGKNKIIREFSQRYNIWEMPPLTHNTEDGHPAPYPESLPKDHILTWSNPGDLVLDPFVGSGTTPKMSKELGRYWVGIDISPEYCEGARKRIARANVPLFTL